MREPDGASKGCAFIKFKTKEEALLAMRFVNGNVYLGSSDKPMEVRFAENKKKPTTMPTEQAQSKSAYPSHPIQSMPSMSPSSVNLISFSLLFIFFSPFSLKIYLFFLHF